MELLSEERSRSKNKEKEIRLSVNPYSSKPFLLCSGSLSSSLKKKIENISIFYF